MRLPAASINEQNERCLPKHTASLRPLLEQLEPAEAIIQRLIDFQVAIPSWALGTGGTRFGRFPSGGEPHSLEQKLEDIGLLHALNASSGAISMHIPWDIPTDPEAIKQLAAELGIAFDAVNSNTFQDRPG